jgi:hypothetical protein
MRKSLLVLAFLLVPTLSAEAQTHPCDVPTPTAQVVTGTTGLGVGFCHNNLDVEGQATTILSFRVTINGVDRFNAMFAPVTAPSATGFTYYETPKTLTLAKGNHTVVVFASNEEGEGPGSDPFVYALRGALPAKSVIKKVVK